MPKITIRRKKSEKTDKPSSSKATSIKRFFYKKQTISVLIFVMIVVGVAGFVYSGSYWYKNSFLKPENIFYGALNNSLSAGSYLRNVDQSSANKTDLQNDYLQFSPSPLIHSNSYVEQLDQNRQKSFVTTENYGTKSSDYIRYTEISIPKTNGDSTDYSKLTNVWAKRGDDKNSGEAQTLSQAALTFIPFGSFSADQRGQFINKMKQDKTYKLNEYKITYENGRPIYTGTVAINPKKLVSFMRDYAKMTGIGDPSQMDPDQYKDQNNFVIQVKIDALSRRLVRIDYPDGQRIETYASIGIKKPSELPAKTISLQELQSRISPKQ